MIGIIIQLGISWLLIWLVEKGDLSVLEYVPIAIHLGWNLTRIFIFSNGPIGNGVLIVKQPQPQVTVSYFIFFVILFLPILSAWIINYLILRKKKQMIYETT